MTRKIFTFLSVSRQLLQRGEPPQRTGFSASLWLNKLLLNRRGAEYTEIMDLELVLDLRCALLNSAI
ncbi:hypothetical protein [Dendronalium sp. ChiSLP03b]|uniref:hypothetical protein n=1 Tax=Dendronalium sp. ChiSLP03b TaxID=3075381 RepID=UPI002ADA80B5|nr:hypothetical protein [Dendronalium sp. ChiSLP03b]